MTNDCSLYVLIENKNFESFFFISKNNINYEYVDICADLKYGEIVPK